MPKPGWLWYQPTIWSSGKSRSSTPWMCSHASWVNVSSARPSWALAAAIATVTSGIGLCAAMRPMSTPPTSRSALPKTCA